MSSVDTPSRALPDVSARWSHYGHQQGLCRLDHHPELGDLWLPVSAPPPPNPPSYNSVTSCSTSASSLSSISSPPTYIPTIAVLRLLVALPSPLSPTSTVLSSLGGRGTSPIPPTLDSPPALSVPLVAATLPSSAPSGPSSASPPGSGACLSCRLYATVWVSPYMPSSRSAHSWRLPHDVFA